MSTVEVEAWDCGDSGFDVGKMHEELDMRASIENRHEP